MDNCVGVQEEAIFSTIFFFFLGGGVVYHSAGLGSRFAF